ncbi:OLC1v1037639C3 [Oldenlandia corymbosa var. corymbosa]|uniref:OLC1v1037639C3 n=1 Tax=Oldenlandia corymbosa var. corymbosa TaxID=529605 RepID=A0AAV1CZ75_OLDCO|nr:OLC1v1037639C3 [Oldenlandia corymbosa var. corymbosa]
MKKSSFLHHHNPKDMLSRSFKPAKCKTSLKLAASRMKLLKNKKEVQVKQMKRELAQLLESGQDQTARIRVEHVVREEKMMAAYDLLEIYCELIVARLPIIESQKECPIDLKEAVTSVIFASPRCGDVPELIDARKLLSAKYGKEFVTAAIELRPNCGVSRLLVEKLSANAPDGQTKLKILTKIAEEHNIKWDPKSFGQSGIQPPDDLLNGPSTLGESTVLPEVPRTTPKLQAPSGYDKMENQPTDFYQQNSRSSAGNPEFASVQDSFSRTTSSSIPKEQMKPSGRQEKEEISESFQREQGSSFSRESWNMEFKDATAAAQAAAESAERASMAARAAAELSSRVQTAATTYSPSENRNSNGGVHRDERPRKHVSSKHSSDYGSQDSVKDSLSDRKPSFQNNRPDMIKQEGRESSSRRSYQDDRDRVNKYGDIGPETLVQDETFAHGIQGPDGHLHKSSSKKEEIKVESSGRRQSGKFESEDMNDPRVGFGAENFTYPMENMIKKQSSVRSYSSYSNNSDSDGEPPNSSRKILGHHDGKGPFFGEDEENNSRDSLAPSYRAADAPVVFDESGSDGEDIGSGTGFRMNEDSNFHFASPGRSSLSNWRANSGSESYIQRTRKSSVGAMAELSNEKHSFAEFSEIVEPSMDGSQADNYGPVTFDDSDGSESDTNMPHAEHGGSDDDRYPLNRRKQNDDLSGTQIYRNDSRKADKKDSRKADMSVSESSPNCQSSVRLGKSHQELKSDVGDDPKYLASSKSKVSSVQGVLDDIDSADLLKPDMDENSDEGMGLNFKNLTGGFRQKGYVRPPYTRGKVDDNIYSTNTVADEIPSMTRQSVAASSAERFTSTRQEKLAGNGRGSRVTDYSSDSDSDSSMDEVKHQPVSLRGEPDIRDARKDVQAPSSLRGSAFFDGDSDDDSPSKVNIAKSKVVSGISKRTKPSQSSSTSISKPKAGSSSEIRVNDSGSGRTPTNRAYGAETPQDHMNWNRNSDQRQKPERTSSGKVASKASETPQDHVNWNRNSDQRQKPERTSSGKVASKANSSSRTSLPEENQKSSAAEASASDQRKAEKPESSEKLKPSGDTGIAREDSLKKPSHVHPKLPDFETLAARIQALQK